MLGTQEGAGHVDRHHLLPLLQRHLVGGFVRAFDAGIVHQDAEAAEAGSNLVEHARHLAFAGDVELPERGLAAVAADGLGGGLAVRFEHIEHGDLRTCRRQHPGGFRADAARGTGDGGYLAAQVEQAIRIFHDVS
ncbi:hypothetical protein D3C72_1131960 [compost metagenome]